MKKIHIDFDYLICYHTKYENMPNIAHINLNQRHKRRYFALDDVKKNITIKNNINDKKEIASKYGYRDYM